MRRKVKKGRNGRETEEGRGSERRGSTLTFLSFAGCLCRKTKET